MLHAHSKVSWQEDYSIFKPKVNLAFSQLLPSLGRGQKNEKYTERAYSLFNETQNMWQPLIAYRWLDIEFLDDNKIKLRALTTNEHTTCDLGFSSRFLEKAHKVLIGVYTVGQKLEQAGLKASKESRVFDSWFYDTMGLAALDQLGKRANLLIEKYASDRNWGVSPVLSPGSVHGWQLKDQVNLCSLLPLKDIGVTLGDSGVMTPFKSLSFLIGCGPQYKKKTVGCPCEVCGKRNDCAIRKANHLN